MVLYFHYSLYIVDFVSFLIFVLFSDTCLWIWTLLGINTEVFGIGHELLWTSYGVDE